MLVLVSVYYCVLVDLGDGVCGCGIVYCDLLFVFVGVEVVFGV